MKHFSVTLPRPMWFRCWCSSSCNWCTIFIEVMKMLFSLFKKKKMHASPRSLASLHCQNLPGNRSCQPWKGIFVILWSINGQLKEILTAGEGCKNTKIISIKLLLRETSGEVCKNNPFLETRVWGLFGFDSFNLVLFSTCITLSFFFYNNITLI